MTGAALDMAAIRSALVAPGTLFEVREEDVRGETMPVFAHRFGSLGAMLEASSGFADRPYIIDGEERVSYAAHLEYVRQLGSVLRDHYGVAPGDRVAIFAANRWEWVVSFWATIAIGAVPCCYNGHWSAEEWEHATELTEPKVMIADGPRLERVADRVGSLPVIDLDADFAAVLTEGSAAASVFCFYRAEEDELSMLVFTSGTTGRPKAVMMTHRGWVGAVQILLFTDATAMVAMGQPVPGEGDVLPPNDTVQLVTAPLFHVAMLISVVLGGIGNGSAMVLTRGRFDEENALCLIEREKVTRWSLLGSVAARVASSPALAKYDTSSLISLGVGGAPVSPAVQDKLRAAFPHLSLAMGMGYSSTEAGSATICHAGGQDFRDHPTSTGVPTVTTQIEIRDPDGNPLPDGEYGEVHVRSPYVMLGYWRNEEASSASLKPCGWLATGDIAKLEDGRLYINSRARDLILVNAENVSPVEVEYVLESHANIREAAVLAVDDELTGDAVMAVVVAEPGRTTDVETLRSWCVEKLARYKVPTRWHIHQGDLPRTASGKLQKHRIRDLIEGTGQEIA
jgi:acyl-CoA synthetase (AMP-forming)/AMP-acid ligase II